MDKRSHALPLLRAAATLSLALTIVTARSQADDDIEQHLRDQYIGKTFILRNFHTGQKLSYDSGGQPSGFARTGVWTVDGFVRVTSLQKSAQRVAIKAERLSLVNDGKAFRVLQASDKKDKKKEEKACTSRSRSIQILRRTKLTPHFPKSF